MRAQPSPRDTAMIVAVGARRQARAQKALGQAAAAAHQARQRRMQTEGEITALTTAQKRLRALSPERPDIAQRHADLLAAYAIRLAGHHEAALERLAAARDAEAEAMAALGTARAEMARVQARFERSGELHTKACRADAKRAEQRQANESEYLARGLSA